MRNDDDEDRPERRPPRPPDRQFRPTRLTGQARGHVRKTRRRPPVSRQRR